MKTLLNGQLNEVSFVKQPLMLDNATNPASTLFTIKLTKIVGDSEYVFANLDDKYDFDPAKEFIGLEVDLENQTLLGGEYKLELYDNFRSYGNYLCLIEDYTFENSDSNDELFSTTVKISNL